MDEKNLNNQSYKDFMLSNSKNVLFIITLPHIYTRMKWSQTSLYRIALWYMNFLFKKLTPAIHFEALFQHIMKTQFK